MIDCHTHIGRVKSWSKKLIGMVEVDKQNLVEYIENQKLEKVILLPLANSYLDIGEDIAKTDGALEAYRYCSEKIIPFCSFDPREGGLAEKIKNAVKSGCRGFGEHKVEIKFNDEHNINLFRICGELELPVLIHFDNRFNVGIENFYEVAAKLEETTFIAHGPRWWARIGSKETNEAYPTGKIHEPGEVIRILKELKNVYADISAFSGLNAISRDREFGKWFINEFEEKIVYGTDFPCINSIGGQFGPDESHISILKSYGLSEGTMRKITHDNILKIIRKAET